MILSKAFGTTSFFVSLIWALSMGVCASCNSASNHEKGPKKKFEQTSFFLDSLRQLEPKTENSLLLEEKKEEARINFLEDSTDLNTIIWYGRRLAYLNHFEEAISIFSRGITVHPNAPELYRHRGHRMISLRRFEEAILDLNHAAKLAQNRPVEIEPDGLPNKLAIPLSNLHYNIYYHLGLAYYLLADYTNAVKSFQSCIAYSNNDDLKAATTYCLVLADLRLGRNNDVEKLLSLIHPNMEIIENQAYLEQLLIFKNQSTSDYPKDSSGPKETNPTSLYGISVWYEHRGDTGSASNIRKRMLSTGSWTYFGYIAAEADSLRRLID